MNFNFDIDLFVKRILPTRKRALNHQQWLQSIHKGLKNTFDDFTAYKDETLKTLSYNSQTLLFEKVLNDLFDDTLRRIYINNTADDLEESHTYFVAEATDDAFAYFIAEEPFNGRYMYKIGEYTNPYDFTVYVPAALASQTEAIAAVVDFYKLAGKRYIIILF